MTVDQIKEAIRNLSDNDRAWLKEYGTGMVLLKMLSPSERKMANKFVKAGLMDKGTSDDGYRNVIIYIDTFVYNRL